MVVASRLAEAVRALVSALLDAAPPYRRIEGRLAAKDAGPDGRFYIYVGPDRVEVDWLTFDMLEVGEGLRARCTRSNRAVNIDRVLPEEEPGES